MLDTKYQRVLKACFLLLLPSPCFSTEAATSVSQLRVTTILSRAQASPLHISMPATLVPARFLKLKTRQAGDLTYLFPQGHVVKKNAVLAKIDVPESAHELVHAQALYEERLKEYKAREKLYAQGFVNTQSMVKMRTQLEEAKATLQKQQQKVEHQQIRAPFTGMWNSSEVEVGDYLSSGTVVGTFIDTASLKWEAYINSDLVQHLYQGQSVTFSTEGSTPLPGKIVWVSAVADPKTNAFKVEGSLYLNPDTEDNVLLGTQGVVSLQKKGVWHILPASCLIEMPSQDVGVMCIDEQNIARLIPVQVQGGNEQGVFVLGLPETVRVVTAGQGFLKEGQRVAL